MELIALTLRRRVGRVGYNPLFWHPLGVYPGRVNPGTLRAQLPLPGGFSGHISAKKGTFLHIFLKYVFSFGSMPNGAIFFESVKRYCTLLGGKTQVQWGPVWVK